MLAAGLAACYPRYDWRDHRPDCARGWCGYVASFPGRVAHATRDVPVGAVALPLSLDVVSIGETTFAIGAFELRPGADASAAEAVFRRKLVDDVGASTPRLVTVTVMAADRSPLPATALVAEGTRDGKALRVEARFVERRDRLVEILVIGPAATLDSAVGRQAIETFFTSLRLD